MCKFIAVVLLLSACLISPSAAQTEPASAQDGGFVFELMPYLWAAGIKGDMTVGDETIEVDVPFSDIADYVDSGGGLLFTAQKNGWVYWGQFDYFGISVDGDTELGEAELEQDTIFLTAFFGREFHPTTKLTLHALAGLRWFSMTNKLTIESATYEQEREADYVDPMFALRTIAPIWKKLRLNGNYAIGGGGDSDFVYELEPILEWHFTPSFSARVGYRTVGMEVDAGDNLSFDGSFNGAIVGVAWTF